MTRTVTRLAILFSACALVVSGGGGSAFASAHRAATGSVPNPGQSDELHGVSTLSPTSAWAAGEFFDGTAEETLILRLQGTTWKKVSSPNPGGTHGSVLEAVSAASATDAWAVGFYNDGTRTNTLALHWTGSSWTQVTVPDPGVNQARLTGVTAISPTNAWAVGDFFDGSATRTLTLHWNGATWSQVSSPNAAGNDFLSGVDARNASDIWAVGQSADNGIVSTLILHFDGGNWTVVPSPSPTGFDDELTGVSVSAASNAWAVGQNFPSVGAQTLILRWNGAKWKRVRSPNPGGTVANDLNGVDIVSNTDAWAVGTYVSGSTGLSLILRWNGTKWKQVTGASPGVHNNILDAVDVDTSTDVWAAGFDAGNHGGFKNLLENWNGFTWTAA